jgi:hypothetical protein
LSKIIVPADTLVDAAALPSSLRLRAKVQVSLVNLCDEHII